MTDKPKPYTWICLTPYALLLLLGALFTITGSTPPKSSALTLFMSLSIFLATWGVLNWLFDR